MFNKKWFERFYTTTSINITFNTTYILLLLLLLILLTTSKETSNESFVDKSFAKLSEL